MKRFVISMLICLLAGCGTSPPRPPECSGPLVPINVSERRP